MTTTAVASDTSAAGHDDAHHDPFLAHHFESHKHQFDSAKLGIWLFLVTEVLFFSGLFCLYLVYRVNHPEIFLVGHAFLDKTLGAVNTVVLLFSSLTMAWAVRAAQLGQQKVLVWCLTATLACAGLFLVIKYFEYSAKIRHGVLWASQFNPETATEYLAEHQAHSGDHHQATTQPLGATHERHADFPLGSTEMAAGHEHGSGEHGEHAPIKLVPKNVGIFFSIYFALTGLHGIHILGGMGAIGWILWRAKRGDFGPHYFGPVDFVGLYWHLVDLIWIYLFPLLYLIH